MTEEQEQRAFADHLIAQIDSTFQRAYVSRINGMSEDEMLIYHDIEAAYRGVDKHVVETCRKTIRSAVKAVDSKVPFDQAHQYLVDQLHEHVDKLVKSNNRKNRRKSHAVGQN